MPKLRALLRRKLIWIPTALLGLWALLGFVIAPRAVRALLPEKLGAVLKRPVSVGEVSLNPFKLDLIVRDFAITEVNGDPFFAFRALDVNASFFALLRGRAGFDRIALEGPQVAVTLKSDGSLSFADLLESSEPPPTAPAEQKRSEPITVSIAELSVTEGSITFHDLTHPEPFTAKLAPLALALTDFTTEAGRGSRYTFKASLGDAQLNYEGDFTARPLKSSGRLAMQGIRLNAVQPYLASVTQLELLGGTLGVSGTTSSTAVRPP